MNAPENPERATARVARFDGRLELAMLPGQAGREWVLAKPFAYRAKDGTRYCVNSGFRTDGASIPRIFWRLIGPPLAGRYAPAALIHDALYAAEAVPREQADALFLEMMEALGVTPWRRKLMYRAVRLGGGWVWRGNNPPSVKYANKFLEVERA